MAHNKVRGMQMVANKTCKRCGKTPLSGLKCAMCGSLSHRSCVAHLKNIKVIDETTIICCENPVNSEVNDELELSFTSATDDSEMCDKRTLEISYLKKIIGNKDQIIQNQRDLIMSLKAQIDLIKHITLNQSHGLENASVTVSAPTVISDNQGTIKPVLHTPVGSNIKKPTDKRSNNIDNKQTNSNINKQSKQNPRPSSAEERDTSPKITGDYANTNVSEEQRLSWNKVVRKKRHSNIKTGTGSNSSLKTVPKRGFIFVSRFEPATNSEDVASLLMGDFPEVSCEQLVSKHPDLYSSFKLSVNISNLTAAMEPSNWPNGVHISRFFHRTKSVSNNQ